MSANELGNKEIFANNLNYFMKANSIDRNKIAQITDVKYSTVADWCNGVYYPRIDKIEMLAEYFGISKADLIENHNWESTNRLATMEKNVVRVPLLGKIPAGIPFEAIEDEYTVDYEEVPTDWTKGNKKYFALKIEGDSMEPEYKNGDVVVFLKTPEFTSGQDCCVRINGADATFKRVAIKENGILLTPLNLDNSTGFLPTLYTKEQVEALPVEILGVAKKQIKFL